MAFTDMFTGAGKARAEKTSRGIQGQFFDDNFNRLNQSVDTARNDFQTGTNNAISTLEGSRDTAGNVIRGGGTDAQNFLTQGITGAQGAFGQARGAFGEAGSAFDRLAGLSDQFGGGTETLLDALGLRGAEGNARATDAFGNSLGNTFERDQGLESIARVNAARTGGGFGGNLDRDAQIFGQNLANSRTDSYLDRLFGLTDRQLGAEGAVASGRSNAQNNIGNTFSQEAGLLERGGLNRAQVAQDTASRIANLTSGTGSQIAGLQQGLGTQLGNTGLNAAQQEIALRQRYGDQLGSSLRGEAQARDEGNVRTFNTGVEALKLAASVAGGVPGLGVGAPSVSSLGAITGGQF